eukprot:2450607-Rhodomonas_salina.1
MTADTFNATAQTAFLEAMAELLGVAVEDIRIERVWEVNGSLAVEFDVAPPRSGNVTASEAAAELEAAASDG